MKHIQLYIAILFLALLTSCDTFHGCGVIEKYGAWEPEYSTKYYNGYVYKYPTGRYFYPVWVRAENGKLYKINVSIDVWNRAYNGEKVIFCSE